MSDLGRGVGTRYDDLGIKDGMTVGELMDNLSKFPKTFTIVFESPRCAVLTNSRRLTEENTNGS
jgi:hypothetical protein